ncbi:DUF2577 domain-containing protein [Aminipila butyrica]|uniref:DUF2577 domain-containing protein n=1 Tax=Aminipila butyrica TaxID=433296 RepID=A0A858BRW2_9FIRM|nr:DUF2577 domain-containing protein [Aminipila butyrica]QIB68643.1 DUF2577 domain-containing protein [Aminipila butyrica]
MSNLVQLIKKASLEAGEAAGPMTAGFGKVVSERPLKIQIDQKITLDGEFLLVPESLTDHQVNMVVDHQTQPSGGFSHGHSVTTDGGSGSASPHSQSNHAHEYSGTKSFTVLNGLRTGDKVILLRVQGGQKYIVLDREGSV